MWRWTGVVLGGLAVTPLFAQQPQRPSELDSGTVVRLHWPEGREKAPAFEHFQVRAAHECSFWLAPAVQW
jgi:hypothetical protein